MSHLDRHFNPGCAILRSSDRTEISKWSVVGFFSCISELLHVGAHLLKTPNEFIRILLHRYTKVCFRVSLVYRRIKFFPCLPSFGNTQGCIAHSVTVRWFVHNLHQTAFPVASVYNVEWHWPKQKYNLEFKRTFKLIHVSSSFRHSTFSFGVMHADRHTNTFIT